jgi:hypothetical protein
LGFGLLAAVIGFLIWRHAPRRDGIDERVVERIENRLELEGYELTNAFFTGSEAVWGGIPGGWILGTSAHETHRPFRRNNGVLQLSYKFKHGQAYDFWVSAEWMHAPRAIALVEELRRVNPAAMVNILTNEVKRPGFKK